MNREIVFSARDNGVTSFMDKMRRSSVEVGRGLLQDSMAQSKSAKEAITNYEKQISLIEKKNRLERDSAKVIADRLKGERMDSQTTVKGRAGVEKDYRESIRQIDRESREDKIQTELLRELINTVKSTASQEIRSDAINSQSESDDLERLLQGEDAAEFRTVAAQLRAERDGGTQKDGKGRTVVGGGIIQGASSIAQQQTGEGAITKTLDSVGKGPIWGTIVGVIAAAFASVKMRADREVSAEQYAAMTGRTVRNIADSSDGTTAFFDGYGPNTLGVSRAQFLSQNIPGAIRGSGTSANANQRAMRHLEIEKALALTSGTGDSLARLSRGIGGDAQSITNDLYSSLYGTGAFGAGNQDMARMQEIMSGFISFQESEFSRAGVEGAGGTMSLRRGLEKLGGRFRRDDYSMQAIQQLNAGLTNEGTPEARAIKFDILRRQNPNKSFFELQSEMEQGINSKGYMQGMLNFVKGTGGDLNSQSLLLDALTGGAMRKKDISSILKGDLSLDKFESQDLGLKDRALASTSRSNEQLMILTDSFKDMMSTIGGGLGDMKKALESFGGDLKQINKNTATMANSVD